MIVFKTYLKIVQKNIFIILLYTLFLIFFAGFNIETNDNNLSFTDTKPDILIINEDKKEGITKHLISYLESNCNHVNIKDDLESINDALFYRDVSFIVYIPKNYQDDLLNDKNPEIKIKSTGDYEASLANLYLEKYLKFLNVYQDEFKDVETILTKLDETLDTRLNIQLTSKLNTTALNKATTYYNFLNYSLLASSLYVISLILLEFNEEKIKKRTIVSSMKQTKINNIIILSNSLFMLTLWSVYVILSFILVGKIMFTANGLILIINSFIFTFLCQVLAIFIANLLNNKDSINGITNVVSLGTSFLCGAFVPISFLPDIVVKVSHIIPSYWYIKTNEIVKTLNIINIDTLKPIILNMIVLIVFIFCLIIFNSYLTKRKK